MQYSIVLSTGFGLTRSYVWAFAILISSRDGGFQGGVVSPADALAERAGDLAALLERELAALDDGELLAVLDRIGEVRRRVDGIGVLAAGEVDRRSRYGDDVSLTKLLGHRTSAVLIAERVDLDVSEAQVWRNVAEWISPRMTLQGEDLPVARPAVASALADGRIAISAAHRIGATLEGISGHATSEELETLEATLIDYASRLNRRDLTRLCRSLPDRFDPDGALPREEALHAKAGLRISRLPDGMERWILTLDPERSGFLHTALDARTAPRRTVRFGHAEATVQGTEETRSLSQRRLDGLIDIAKESLAHDRGQVAGSPVTMLVTVALENLISGLGNAQIAGIDEPISAATARRLASDAEIIPIVLGTESENLDQGRAKRLATPAQRAALAQRDRGCAWPGCDAPPGWCEVAHILAWILGGPTDLTNLILLCPFHHRRFDGDGWTLQWRDGIPWFIPPPHIDPTRTPQPGGNIPLAA